MGGYGGWGGGVNLGGYAPTAFYPGQITAPQPVQAPAVTFPQAQSGGGNNAWLQNYLGSIAASNAADQAAQLVFQEWQMRTGDERLAMEKAQQAWSQTFQERQQAFSEGVTEAGLTGTYEGAPTLQAIGQQNQTGLALLQQQASLQGPRDWQKYWGMAASAPQGLTSALSSLAGRYNYAPGYQGTPGPATLGSRTQDLLSGGALGAGGQGGTSGAGTGQAGNAWQWNLQNWNQMSPSLQQGVLGAAEAGGAYGPDLEALLRQAAPRYTGPGATQIGL